MNKIDIHDTISTTTNGVIGVLSSCFAVLTSFQEHLEWGMRIVSLFLGIIVAGITIYNLLKKKKPK
jgi:heme A synthase